MEFLKRAPLRQARSAMVEMPVDGVFDEIARNPEGWPRWFLLARDCHYEGDPPYGVGSVRQVSLRGGIHATERILAWEEDKRFTFCVDNINLPGMRGFMEDWTLEDATEGRTRLQWALAADAAGPLSLLLQLSRAALDRLFNDAANRLPKS